MTQKMFQSVLFIKLLLVHHATQSNPAVSQYANCKDNVTLKCPGVDTDKMDFLSVTWYKVSLEGKRGIIRQGKRAKTPQNYNFTRSARFAEKYGLLLPDVTPEDSGFYECAISANVGGQNMDLEVNLVVQACVTEAVLPTVTSASSWTHSNQLCHKQVEDLPVMWSIIGYVTVALCKIIFSLICIWVIRAVKTRSSRRRQQKW